MVPVVFVCRLPGRYKMNRREFVPITLLVLTVVFFSFCPICEGQTPAGFESLFNGVDLSGWARHDNLPGHGLAGKWTVEDGAIVGVQDPPGKGGFLSTLRNFRDFELTLETKIDWPFDSGIFLRTGPDGKSHQVTLDYRSGGEIGGIYCPWTRDFVQHCPDGVKHFRKDQWNRVRIICQGEPARIRVWINDTLVTDFQHTGETTKGIPTEGRLSLQVHPGGEGYDNNAARFRNIFVREISPEVRNCHPPTDAYDGWRLGTQAYSFRSFTFYEAVDKTASLGLNWIEGYPGQQLSKEIPDVRFDHDMAAELRQQVRHKLSNAGVRLVNYGVVGLPNNEVECRKVFDFAQDMGIETIVSEPPEDAFDLVDKLCNEYKIKVAIHNHPKPSQYWNPDKVLEVCKGRSKWIGACADTGHWMRSKVDPLEALRKLEGRIVSLHFKDLNDFGREGAYDVVWGTGKANVKSLLEELHRQKFTGVFSVEYEHNWENSVPEIRKSVAYFSETAGGLKPSGWRNLFAEDLSDGVYEAGSWTLAEGALTLNGGGDIWTKGKYGDFILDVGFKVAKDTNSGIFIRTGNMEWLPWIEVQVLDSYGKSQPDKHDCGGIFDILAPSENTVNEPGQWNRMTISAQGSHVIVVMNGREVVDMDLDRWTEPRKNPDGTPNKFGVAYKDLPRMGYIGFQDHGQAVWYRNIKIKSEGLSD